MTNRFRTEMNARLREMDWHGEDGVLYQIHKVTYVARVSVIAAFSCVGWLGSRLRNSLKEWYLHGK